MIMSLVRSRIALSAVVLGLVAFAGILFVGPLELPIPRLAPGDTELRLLLPALLASAISSVFATPLLTAEAMSPRAVRRTVTLVAASLLGVLTFVLGVIALLTHDAGFLASARNLLIYVGVGSFAATIGGGLGTVIPVVATILLAVVASEEGTPLLAWVVSPTWDPVSFVAALCVAGMGLTVSARGPCR